MSAKISLRFEINYHCWLIAIIPVLGLNPYSHLCIALPHTTSWWPALEICPITATQSSSTWISRFEGIWKNISWATHLYLPVTQSLEFHKQRVSFFFTRVCFFSLLFLGTMTRHRANVQFHSLNLIKSKQYKNGSSFRINHNRNEFATFPSLVSTLLLQGF